MERNKGYKQRRSMKEEKKSKDLSKAWSAKLQMCWI